MLELDMVCFDVQHLVCAIERFSTLHHRNLVLAGDRLLALDWEYAGPGDPAADVAAFARYHDLDGAAIDALLEQHGADGPALRARVHALAWIFDCLWYGWLGVAGLAGLDDDRERRDALVSRLGC